MPDVAVWLFLFNATKCYNNHTQQELLERGAHSMARPSKLSEMQKEEILKAAMSGESITSIAKRFKVAKSTISAHVSDRSKTGKELANQIVDVSRKVAQLPVIEQRSVIDFARSLMTISENMANAAISGSYTSMRLNQIAANQVDKIDEENPLNSEEHIRAIAMLTKTGNEASLIGRELLNVQAKKPAKQEDDNAQPTTLTIVDASAYPQ